MRALDNQHLVRIAAAAIHDGFVNYNNNFRRITQRARARFEARDWSGARNDLAERIELYEKSVARTLAHVRRLLDVLHNLVDLGNTVVVIEHQLDVVKTADWIIDLGPEGGERGGKLIAAGTPEEILRHKSSHTAEALRKVLR